MPVTCVLCGAETGRGSVEESGDGLWVHMHIEDCIVRLHNLIERYHPSKECPACQGEGLVGSMRRRCLRCNGGGRV